MNDLDAVGYPKRNIGERYLYKGRAITIIKNLGLLVLCPCPDMLVVRYDAVDDVEDTEIENTLELERIN